MPGVVPHVALIRFDERNSYSMIKALIRAPRSLSGKEMPSSTMGSLIPSSCKADRACHCALCAERAEKLLNPYFSTTSLSPVYMVSVLMSQASLFRLVRHTLCSPSARLTLFGEGVCSLTKTGIIPSLQYRASRFAKSMPGMLPQSTCSKPAMTS